MGAAKVFFRKKTTSKDLTPLQRGLKKAVSLNYYSLDPIEEESIDRMRALGLLKVDLDGSVSPTKMGEGIIDGSIETNEIVPPFVAGLVRWIKSVTNGSVGFHH